MQYEKLFTINVKNNSANITFNIAGKKSDIISIITLDIINCNVTNFSYKENKKYGQELIIYKIAANAFEIWIELDNDDVSISNLQYDINKCIIKFYREKKKALLTNYLSKDRCTMSNYNDNLYEIADGTANSILLTMSDLADGYWKKFIASFDNNGLDTIVNDKPLYKINSTTPPNLVKGKPYEIFYSLDKDCFFLKASATGNALPNQVLENVTYSTAEGTDFVGTMKNRGKYDNYNFGLNGQINLPEGYYVSVNIKQSLAKQAAITEARSVGNDSTYLYARIPQGTYFTNATSGYPEIKLVVDKVSLAVQNLPNDKQIEIIKDLGGLKVVTGELDPYTIENRRDNVMAKGLATKLASMGINNVYVAFGSAFINDREYRNFELTRADLDSDFNRVRYVISSPSGYEYDTCSPSVLDSFAIVANQSSNGNVWTGECIVKFTAIGC